MTLCSLCKGIRIDNLVPYCPPGQEDEEFTVGYSHQPSYRALEISSQKCPLCKLLLHALEAGDAAADRMPEEVRDEAGSQIWLIGGQEMIFNLNQPMRISQIGVQAGNAWRDTVLGLYTTEDDPAAISGDIVGREISTDPASDRNFAFINQWIRDCVARHTECAHTTDLAVNMTRENELMPLPTRLINVGAQDGSEYPFLWHSGGSTGQYVALSYCWGSGVTLTTEKGTYNARCEGMELSSIPKTIQDAIAVTRRLGVRYLWVDALCIIQDDEEDWQHEAAQMGTVYRNSLLTISATGSSDSGMGCFIKYVPSPIHPVKLDYQSHDGSRKGHMFIRPQPATITESLDRSPVSSRGWCLQERFLSRRILHYSKHQLYWECQKHCVAEDGTITSRLFKQSFNLRNYGLNDDPASIFWRWCLLVEEYSKRKLTKPSDKLPAISGLASEVYRRTGDQYLAGLWKSNLHIDLLWESTPGGMVRPQGFRAPSWSWASLDGPIRYAGVNRLAKAAMPDIRILDARITNVDEDRHGGVSGGYLQISGLLKYASRSDTRTRRPIDGWGSSVPWGYYLIGSNSESVGIAVLDGVHDEAPRDLLCLKVSYNPGDDSPDYNVLVLEPTGSTPQEYRRLGTGEVNEAGWFDDCPNAAVTIV
ncbi:MAG: hypothetical protein M1839_003960 [Geoglossum umbratile]|nr:MAG: hypothetical protein M1839_003960 [Geoglossum umbratile]